MISTKYIRTCTDEEAVALTRERPSLLYSVPSAYETRTPEVYKACALAALEGLKEAAGHTFPRKSCGEHGWKAHHVTKCIFEEQLIFDPYADKTFCDAALELCSYYILRYIAPDALPKASDFTLDQFAACFTTKGALYLRKRGCDFSPDDARCGGSDLQNYRLYLEYCNREGRRVIGDIALGMRYETKNRADVPEAWGLSTWFQIDKETGSYAYEVPGYAHVSYDYTQADVLRLINSDSAIQYDHIEIVD